MDNILIHSRESVGVQLHSKISNIHLEMKLLVKTPYNWKDIEFPKLRSTLTIKLSFLLPCDPEYSIQFSKKKTEKFDKNFWSASIFFLFWKHRSCFVLIFCHNSCLRLMEGTIAKMIFQSYFLGAPQNSVLLMLRA